MTVTYEAVNSDFSKLIDQAYEDIKDHTDTQEDTNEIWSDFVTILMKATKGTVFADMFVDFMLEVEANTLAVAEAERPDDPVLKQFRKDFDSDMSEIMGCLYGASLGVSN